MPDASLLLLFITSVITMAASWRVSAPVAFGFLAVGEAIIALVMLLGGDRLASISPAACALIAAWLWWRGTRNRRRRVMECLGAKSRALRWALVRRMRDRQVPVPAPA